MGTEYMESGKNARANVRPMSIRWRIWLINASFIAVFIAMLFSFSTAWGSTMPGGTAILLVGFAALMTFIFCRSRQLQLNCSVCGNPFQKRNAGDERTACRRCDPAAWPRAASPSPSPHLGIVDVFFSGTTSAIVFAIFGTLLRKSGREIDPLIAGVVGFGLGIAWSLWRRSVLRHGNLPSQTPQVGINDSQTRTTGEYSSNSTSRYIRVATKVFSAADWLKSLGALFIVDAMLSVWIAGALSPYVRLAISFPLSFFGLPIIIVLLLRRRATRNMR